MPEKFYQVFWHTTYLPSLASANKSSMRMALAKIRLSLADGYGSGFHLSPMQLPCLFLSIFCCVVKRTVLNNIKKKRDLALCLLTLITTVSISTFLLTKMRSRYWSLCITLKEQTNGYFWIILTFKLYNSCKGMYNILKVFLSSRAKPSCQDVQMHINTNL